MTRAAFGEADTAIAMANGFRGMALLQLGQEVAAESSLCQAISIWQVCFGSDCPQQASAMRLLGDLYAFQHRDVESENLYRGALRILGKWPAYRGIWTSKWMCALLTNNLGVLYASQGRYKEAVELYEEALRLWSEESGEDSPDASNARLNLGAAARDQGDYATAEQHVRRALAAYERPETNQPHLRRNADGVRLILAMICMNQRKPDEALTLLNRAVAGLAESYGAMSRGMLQALEIGMVVESHFGHWPKAAEYAEWGIRILEQSDSRNPADLSHYLLYLGDFLYPQGKIKECAAAFDRANSLRQSFVRGAFSYASERTKVLYLRQFPLVEGSCLSFALETNTPANIESALGDVLFGKASILDALAEERQAALCSEDVETRNSLDRFAAICRDISELTISGMNSGDTEAAASISSLYRRKDSLELALSQQCVAFDSLMRLPPVSAAEVATNLEPGSVLWEYVTYHPYCFNAPDSVLPRHYLAFTLGSKGRMTVSDLGEAAIIDSLVGLINLKMRDGSGILLGEDERLMERDLARVTSKLAELIVSPLIKTADGCNHIIVSPDGQLSLMPFEMLPLSDGRYSIEQYEFSYVSTGRDLLKLVTPRKSNASGAVVVAAPDFDVSQSPVYAHASPSLSTMATAQFRGPTDRSECLSVPFSPLPASRKEGDAVAHLLSARLGDEVVYLTGPLASEDSLKHLTHAPRVLHLATHGYFCTKAGYSNIAQVTESPLLYSGLALAGSNELVRNARDSVDLRNDGILTALEASSLNLSGTDLVVLGSCRAGTGTVVPGEGVYGLRRAFELAGARSVMMSMFDIPDMTARDLMTRFYTEWLSGTSKSTALRKAMLAQLRQRRQQHGAAHPLFWGGFVLNGDYR